MAFRSRVSLGPFLSFVCRMSAPALLACLVMLPRPAEGVPITYELDMTSLVASGSFAGKPFANSVVLLTFEGDTTNVIPFTVQGSMGPVTGYLNLVGTAKVHIFDENGNSFQDTFLPSAGIFVSVDNTNGGVGFGSLGVPPSNPNFPGQVAYPAGMLVIPPSAVATYDLKSDIMLPVGSAQSCVGFATPAGCAAPLRLPMTSGDLILNLAQRSSAEFSAVAQAVTPFTSFSARGEIATSHFDVRGRFALGRTSNGINPLSEAVTLRLDSYTVTIAPGSFGRTEDGGYEFEGKVADVRLAILLKAHSPALYTFEVRGVGPGLPILTTPASMELTIGDDSGSTTVAASSDE